VIHNGTDHFAAFRKMIDHTQTTAATFLGDHSVQSMVSWDEFDPISEWRQINIKTLGVYPVASVLKSTLKELTRCTGLFPCSVVILITTRPKTKSQKIEASVFGVSISSDSLWASKANIQSNQHVEWNSMWLADSDIEGLKPIREMLEPVRSYLSLCHKGLGYS
jgi:hypothetical protein